MRAIRESKHEEIKHQDNEVKEAKRKRGKEKIK
jgi:hypothetical protein